MVSFRHTSQVKVGEILVDLSNTYYTIRTNYVDFGSSVDSTVVWRHVLQSVISRRLNKIANAKWKNIM